ncbi:MAG TPA: FtsW/RodA/SpoVE family cell cycle protein [Actinomycetes bacterium]|nr:FtsW/RodA/SpoVE family cell cycle protein [Actinomycetes bacterium]
MESRRNVELTLLLLALVLSVGGYIVVGLVADNTVPAGSLGYGATLAVLFIGAHLVLRWQAPQADPLLLPGAALLNGLGLVMVRRLDYAAVLRKGGYPQAPSQALWTVLGLTVFAAVIVLVRDHRVLDRYRYTWLLLGLFLLVLPAVPGVGQEINGARLWVRIGPFNGQPAELAKIALVVFLAAYLAERKELLATATYRVGPLLLPEIKYFMPMLMAWGVSLFVLFFEKDLGSSLLFFGVFVALLYVATGRFSYVAAGLGLFMGGAFVAYQLFAHVQVRVATWLHVWDYYDGRGFQLAQGLFALATGGILGEGWNQGQPNLIPFASTDFVFDAFGEELGLLGVTAMLLVYLLMVFRGFRVALAASDDFGKLLGLGLVVSFSLQVFVIVGGVTRLIPLTGITLPFVSYGGSSLVANYALIALLCRISSESTPAPARSRTGPGPADAAESGELTVVR